MTNALVHYVVTETSQDGALTAVGVKLQQDDNMKTIRAKKEVIVCAGYAYYPRMLTQ
jgi:3D (Asp-Asp-Asp) domain-containing protein